MNTTALISASFAFAFAVVSPTMLATSATSETRAAIAAQSRALTDALAAGDAKRAALVFTPDAKLIVSGVGDVINGRVGIEGFWRSATGSGLGRLELTTGDLEGEGDTRFETGTYRGVGADGAELGHGHYLFVWKRDGGVWRIHRDIGSEAPAGAAAAGRTAVGRAAASHASAGLPADYRGLELLGVGVGSGEPSIHSVYANDRAAATLDAGRPPFPEGSVIIMEFANSLRDGEGELIRERDGTPRRGEIVHVDVMRQVPGFGAIYGDSRAGDWEFASFRPDGGVLVAPENGAQCAACHRNAGAAKGFVFRVGRPPAAK